MSYSCIYCPGQCRFALSILTCERCGSEQGDPAFEDEWNVSDRTCEFRESDYKSNDDQIDRLNHYQKDKQQAAIKDIFMTIQDSTNLPDSTMELAKALYTDYLSNPKHRAIRGEARRMEFCAACTYFATKSMVQGVLTQNRVVELVFKNSIVTLHWACKELLEIFWNDRRYSELFAGRDVHITEAITRVSKVVSKHSDIPVRDIYKLTHKMVDKIKRKDETFLRETSSERLASSLVFVGCKLLKKGIPLNTMALLSGTNVSHLLKLEKKIQNYIHG